MARPGVKRGSAAHQREALCPRWQSVTLSKAMLARLVATLFTCLFACSCAHETTERPAHDEASAVVRAPAPLPDTAFRSDNERRAVPTAALPLSRFETRRIGSDEGERPARYRGAPVDLDVKSADLADVFRLLADVGRVNIVVSGEVTGTLTLHLEHVPWDQALDVIARAKGLALERDGQVILVRTLTANASAK